MAERISKSWSLRTWVIALGLPVTLTCAISLAKGWTIGFDVISPDLILGAVLTGLVAMLLTHWHYRAPLAKVARAAREFAEGNESARVRLADEDIPPELAEVRDAFNQMATQASQNRALLVAMAEEAREASRTKSRFLANMSHELRTPLNAIIGFSEIMKSEILGPMGSDRYLAYARDVHDSGRHLLNIVNDLLDLSKIEAGELVLEEEPLCPAMLLRTAMTLIEPTARSRGIRLGTEIPDLGMDLLASPVRLRQILLNLLSNAVKYTPEGGTVDAGLYLDKDGCLRFLVIDSGIGMSPREIRTALTPFGQVNNHHNRTFVGTGLGLPLTKQLVELHGGTLEIDSAPGKGTRIDVIFPAARIRPRTGTSHGDMTAAA